MDNVKITVTEEYTVQELIYVSHILKKSKLIYAVRSQGGGHPWCG